jgi:thymidylate synthase
MLNPISRRWHDVYHHNLLRALGEPDRELINHTWMVKDPADRSINSETRRFNEDFSRLMYDWMMEGGIIVSEEMLAMNPNAKNYETVFAPEGLPFNCTAYGPRIREQLPHVVELLRMTNGETRRANIMILGPQDIHAGIAREHGTTNCEYPCTLGFNFRIRHSKLDMITSMRSNNYTTTVNQDFFIFTLLQERLADQLGVMMGDYYHYTQSGHVFEHDVGRATDILFEYVIKSNMSSALAELWDEHIERAAIGSEAYVNG